MRNSTGKRYLKTARTQKVFHTNWSKNLFAVLLENIIDFSSIDEKQGFNTGNTEHTRPLSFFGVSLTRLNDALKN